MDSDPPLLAVPLDGVITNDQFHAYLDMIGHGAYQQWTLAEYETPAEATRLIRAVNTLDGMSETRVFVLDAAAQHWRRVS